MKKNLRLLCLGLAAATFTASFAQAENMTAKLVNADMERGVIGWSIDFDSHIWKKNTKSQAAKRGFHGVTNTVLENWKSDATSGLTDNTISQTVTNLPNGTYVFGAYIGASQQGSAESNRETIEGVTLFANEGTAKVATDNPDNSAAKYAHTAKFNVAATVTDGTLNVGLKAETTNANYLVMDNATLYFFGDMDAATALDEMAKIDMAATVAIADTCFAHKMNVDSLALITEAKAAAEAVATADAAWQADEDLYWAIFKATKSISDYRSFNNAIAAAEVVAAGEWSEQISDFVDALNASIVAAKTTYEEATKARPELNEEKAALNEAAALVALDSSYVYLDWFDEEGLYELPAGDGVGEYSDAKITALELLSEEARSVVDAAYEYQMTAVEARHKYDSLYAEMQAIIDNPNSVDAFPFTVTASQEPNADGRYEFTSKTYTLAYPVTNIRFTFLDTFCPNGSGKGDPVFVALGEFYMYDADGELIELTADNFSTNAQESSEGPIANICDGDISTYFHSDWHNNVKENHYIEVSLPEGLDLTTFSFGWIDRGNRQNIPLVVEVSSLSTATADLMAAIAAAKTQLPYTGTDPGFYKDDVSSYYVALAAAEALVGTEATDDAIYTAIGALEEEQAKIDEMGLIMPETGKKYRFISADVRFFEKQGVQKALTVRNDTLWWETAHPDSVQQEFILETISNSEGRNLYKMQHVKTGLYVNSGDEGDYHPLFATADTVELIALGAGQFGLQAHSTGVFHTCDHNSGSLGVGWNGNLQGAAGGLFGDYSGIIPYGDASLDGGSAWYIREMCTLPHATKSLTDLNFQSEAIHLYAGVNSLTLTADKDCAFADLVIYDKRGNEIASSVTVGGANATVVLDTTVVESFSFVFTNTENVATVTINGAISKLSELQTAYDAAVAVAPVAGEGVMEFKDLTAYNNALAVAEKLLVSGGTDEAIVSAIEALEKAVAELTPNLPEADKEYYIVSALDAFKTNHGVNMMMYANAQGTPRWMYENTEETNRLWKFEAVEVEEGKPAAFYIMNVATGTYFGSSADALVEKENALGYRITQLQGTVVAIDGGVNDKGEPDNSKRLHANQHGGGAGKGSNIVYWSSGFGTASAWYICEKDAYLNDINFEEIEDATQEEIAPVKKGIYDLFGRRISTPAATGIYIVDGKKRVIKK